MNKTILTILFFALMATAAFAQKVAVLEITIPDTPEQEESEEVALLVKEFRLLTDELRRQAAITLPPEFSVFTREQILALVSDENTAAVDTTAKPEFDLETDLGIGKALKSDFVTSGHINKVGSLLSLKVSLFKTESGQLLADFTGESQDLKGLMDVIRGNAPKLFKKLFKEEEEAKPEPVKVTVEVQAIPANVAAEPKAKAPIWVAIGLDVLGAAGIGLGIYNHVKANDRYDDYRSLPPQEYYGNEARYSAAYKKVTDAKTARNVFFGVGGALLLSGVVVHVWF